MAGREERERLKSSDRRGGESRGRVGIDEGARKRKSTRLRPPLVCLIVIIIYNKVAAEILPMEILIPKSYFLKLFTKMLKTHEFPMDFKHFFFRPNSLQEI